MPTLVAATGSWRNDSSTNSSLSAEKVRGASGIWRSLLIRGTRRQRSCTQRPTPASRARAAQLGSVPSAGACDVRRLPTLGAGNHVEFDPLSLLEGAEAAPLDRGEVNEDVLAGFIANESETLGLVEPLDRPLLPLATRVSHRR